MTKTKDEMSIVELATHYGIIWDTISANDKSVMADGFLQGINIGEIRGQKHRQKEIDELQHKLDLAATMAYDNGKEDASSWWAERYLKQTAIGATNDEAVLKEARQAERELDAAAKRVMGGRNEQLRNRKG